MIVVLYIALFICFAFATDEYETVDIPAEKSASQNGFKLSGHVVALVASVMSVVVMLAVWDCHRRSKKTNMRKKEEEEEQVRWFEKQREQMKTPAKKPSVIKLHCVSVPVARLRGKPRDAPSKLPVLNIDASSPTDYDHFQFPDEVVKDEASGVSNASNEEESLEVEFLTDSQSCLSLEIEESQPEIQCSNVALNLKDTETTVEYTRTGSNL